MIEQVVDRRRRDAVDAQPPGDRTFRPSLRAGADIGLAIHAFDGGEDREAGLRAIAHDIGIGRTAETTAGREKGDGLHQIGLARAVIARQHDMTAIETQRGGCVVSKVGQGQTVDGGLFGHLCHAY